MNRKWFKIFAVPALAGGMMFAQTTPGTQTEAQPQRQEQSGRQHNWNGRRGGHERIVKMLNLTQEQQDQAKAILKQSHESVKPVTEQLRKERQEMMQAVKANDSARIEKLASREANLQSKVIAARSLAFAKIYNTVLTPEQRAKADQLPSMFHQWRGERGQHRRPQTNS
jgi:Spy/CpxP family protein refolding chaperone